MEPHVHPDYGLAFWGIDHDIRTMYILSMALRSFTLMVIHGYVHPEHDPTALYVHGNTKVVPNPEV